MKQQGLINMQLYPWIVGRARRIMPIVLAVVIVFFIYKSTTQHEPLHPKRAMSMVAPTAPPLPPKPPSMVKWLVLHGYHDPSPRLCSQASMMFNAWNIVLLTNDSNSVHSCDSGLTKSIIEIAGEFPGIHIPESPLMWTFLYVIKLGAEAIYLPSKTWMQSMQDNPGVILRSPYSGLVYQPKPKQPYSQHMKILEFFPHRHHFGCKATEGSGDLQMTYDLAKHDLPDLQAPIVLPKSSEEDVPQCDPRAPPVTIPEGVFIDDLQVASAMYTKRVFWALAIPALLQDATLPSRTVTLLKLLIQKVLWASGRRVMLWHNSFNRLVTNSTGHSQLPDRDIVVLDQLRNLYCHKNKPRECLIRSLTILNQEVLLRQESIQSVSAWFDALAQLNVNIALTTTQDQVLSKDVKYFSVDYSQKVNRRTHFSRAPYVPVTNAEVFSQTLHETCGNLEMPSDAKVNLTHPWEQFADVLLIVTFNSAHYEVIQYLEILYRPFFPYMLYCGPSPANDTQKEIMKKLRFTFLRYAETPSGHLPGSFNYECPAMAMMMSYDVAGYAVISDDVLLSLADLKERQRHVVWYIEEHMVRMGDIRKALECRLGTCDYHPHWRWWEDYKQQNLAVMYALKKGQITKRVHHRCYNQLKTLTGGEYRMFGGNSDFYYVPQRLTEDFAALAFLFKSQSVFLELAVPTILSCLENPDDIERLALLDMLHKDREYPWLHFSSKFKRKSYMHPVKWSPLIQKSPEHQLFFCTKVLPYIHDFFGRIS